MRDLDVAAIARIRAALARQLVERVCCEACAGRGRVASATRFFRIDDFRRVPLEEPCLACNGGGSIVATRPNTHPSAPKEAHTA